MWDAEHVGACLEVKMLCLTGGLHIGLVSRWKAPLRDIHPSSHPTGVHTRGWVSYYTSATCPNRINTVPKWNWNGAQTQLSFRMGEHMKMAHFLGRRLLPGVTKRPLATYIPAVSKMLSQASWWYCWTWRCHSMTGQAPSGGLSKRRSEVSWSGVVQLHSNPPLTGISQAM